jgi:hypothetical protein
VPLEQPFAVDLRVQAGQPVSHLPVTLLYDPEVLAIDAVYEGDFLAGSGVVLADDETPGRLVIGASVLGEAPGIVGDGTLVTIHFRAIAEGDGKLRWEQGRALGPNLEPIGPVRRGRLRIEADRSAAPPIRPERPERPRVA